MSDVTPATVKTMPADRPVRAAMSRRRHWLVVGLVVLATVIGFGSLLTTWVNRQMLDEQSWKKTSSRLIKDPKVQSALSVYLVDQLYANVDVQNALEQRLPKGLKQFAGPAAAALQQPATKGVAFLLAEPRIQNLFVNASVLAQQKAVNVLESKTGYGISTGHGVVTLDLGELLKEIGLDLGLPASAVDKLPAGTGVVTVMRSDQLSLAQDGVRAVRVLSVWLIVLVFALYALAVYLAHGRRRETLRMIGWAFVVAGLVGLVIQHLGGNYAVNSLTPSPYRPAGDRIWVIATSILRQISWAVILYGIVLVVATMLAGPTAAATAVRRTIAPVVNHRPGITWGTAAAVFVLLVLWGGTHALRTPLGILFLGLLLAAGVEALRRQTLQEFPDAAPRNEPGAVVP